MTESPLQVPTDEELEDLLLSATIGDEPWVRTLSTTAQDGSIVKVTSDEIAGSVTIGWSRGGSEIVSLYRESATKLSISDESGMTFFIESRSEDLLGRLRVTVAESVTITDAVLWA